MPIFYRRERAKSRGHFVQKQGGILGQKIFQKLIQFDL